MKTKLLKILRAKFFIEYYPGQKLYKVNGIKDTYTRRLEDALSCRDCAMINYAREWYEKKSKHYKI